MPSAGIKTIDASRTTDAVTDTGAAGDSAGDILTFANEVFDADDKNKIGTNQGICFRTVVGKAWECFWTVSLDKGLITVEGPFYDELIFSTRPRLSCKMKLISPTTNQWFGAFRKTFPHPSNVGRSAKGGVDG